MFIIITIITTTIFVIPVIIQLLPSKGLTDYKTLR